MESKVMDVGRRASVASDVQTAYRVMRCSGTKERWGAEDGAE